MTNNPTIDGVSRELLEEFIALSIQGKIGNWVNLRNELRTLLDAPAVERQENKCGQCSASSSDICNQNGCGFLESGNGEPEVAALQSTIAQLEDKLNKAIDLDFQRRETIARLEGKVQELESGDEPIYQVQYRGEGGGGWSDAEKESYDAKVPHPKHWKTRIVYAAPPAPVSVSVDLRKRLNDVWLFLDGQTELNGCVWGEKPEGRHAYWWRKELRAVIEDVNDCLDATAALNGPAK